MDVVLVTGCSTAFGRETALYLAGRGFRVYAGLEEEAARGQAEEEAARRGVRLHPLRLEVASPPSIAEAVRTVVEQGGGLYGVVHTAGVLIRGYFEDLLDSEVRETFEINLFGTLSLVRAALPFMRAAGRGRIVIVTSVAASIGSPTSTAYSASRFAQSGFAESLALEVAPLGVRVALVEPGITRAHLESVDRGPSLRSRDPGGPYHAWFLRADRLLQGAAASSPIEPQDVARAVEKALRSRRPRLRYRVGRRAKTLMALRRHLPGELFDRFYSALILRQIVSGTGR